MAKVNKVNKVTPGEEQNIAEKEKGRKNFVVKEAMYVKDEKLVSAINSDGLLIAVPKPVKNNEGKVLYEGFDVRKHLPLKKTNFASIVTYMYYQSYIARCKAAILVKVAEDKEKKAERMEKFGDDQTRRKVAKIAKMRETLAALQKQLEEEGVDVSELI